MLSIVLKSRHEIIELTPCHVIVDGDSYIFSEELLRQGFSGGEDAARLLLMEVRRHIKDYKGSQDWRIVVRIFANVGDLSTRCWQSNITQKPNVVLEFVDGFHQSQGLVDFVDVGYGEQRVDRKLKGKPQNPLFLFVLYVILRF